MFVLLRSLLETQSVVSCQSKLVLLACSLLQFQPSLPSINRIFTHAAYSSTLMMKAADSSKTLAPIYQNACCQILDHDVNTHHSNSNLRQYSEF